jgi:hypothetical protein
LGANTPCQRVRLTRGFGTSAANFTVKSAPAFCSNLKQSGDYRVTDTSPVKIVHCQLSTVSLLPFNGK